MLHLNVVLVLELMLELMLGDYSPRLLVLSIRGDDAFCDYALSAGCCT
jgi:hypothetical protein